MPEDQPKAPAIPPAKSPCAFALGAMGVPARRWNTRTDLYQRLDEAKKYLETGPLDEISLAEAASLVGLSLHHFLRLFHEVYGETPHQHLMTRRIETAKQMLLETELSILEIASAVGYVSQSAFGRLFRAKQAIAPPPSGAMQGHARPPQSHCKAPHFSNFGRNPDNPFGACYSHGYQRNLSRGI